MKSITNYFISQKKKISKILFTLVIIFIYVIGTKIPVPCLNKENIDKMKIISLISSDEKLPLFILSLGIMPYITVSIIIQLASKIIPFLKEWNEQGEKGKNQLNLFSRFLTLFLSFGYGLGMLSSKNMFLILPSGLLIRVKIAFFLVVGVFICIWLADLITTKGIGNGVSILIVIGISKEVFNTFRFLYNPEPSTLSIFDRFVIFGFLLFLLILTIILCSAYLKIPILYYTSNINKIHEAKIDKHIPFKINSAGVLPIILATSLMNSFDMISSFMPDNKFKKIINSYFSLAQRQELGLSFFLYLSLILLFSIFSIFMIINPHDVTQHLSKQDSYIEGIKPGDETTYKITDELFKITLIGAICLTLLAAIPDILYFYYSEKLPHNMKFGGTSLLIIVGVALECVQRMNTQTQITSMHNKLF
uniref:Protein translocase subunit SecY n=1 Tax=Candidatus Phytoplasma phoenicium TaxID=198422 RepID=H2E5V9_9MOLU|nr:SecY [Candidatus Phytoplasma phoenicium]AEY68226.1 SecY [Candidatus Phytoplasma phoenicium]